MAWSVGSVPFNVLREGRVVAVCRGANGSQDAAAIVAACNQHEALVAQRDALRAALKTLAAEVGGLLGTIDAELRAAAGHTNVNVLTLRWQEAKAAIDLAEGQS